MELKAMLENKRKRKLGGEDDEDDEPKALGSYDKTVRKSLCFKGDKPKKKKSKKKKKEKKEKKKQKLTMKEEIAAAGGGEFIISAKTGRRINLSKEYMKTGKSGKVGKATSALNRREKAKGDHWCK